MAKKLLNIVPYPNSVEFTCGCIDSASIEPDIINIERVSSLAEDCYRLEIKKDGITVQAGGDSGAFYARQSLIQLVNGGGRVSCCTVTDSPACAHRGFMLDSARHMPSVDNIKKLIDAMALLKMNVFHWHLTDDQGWRIQIDKYPLLTEIGSRRKCSEFGGEHTSDEYGGFYTKDEIRDVVSYCSDRFITVIPEIDLPGHTTSAIAAYPALSCRGAATDVATNSGIYPDILCMGKQETLDFVFDVLDEVVELFPGEFFHIGGDEAPKNRWKECPLCQEKMHSLGLENEEQLQGWFSNELASFLRKKGKTAIIFNDGLNSGLVGNDVIAHRWSDSDNVSTNFANNGGRLIMSDFSSTYLDFPYGLLSLKKVYDYSLIPQGLLPENKGNIIGVEAPVWAEYTPNFERVGYQVFPRLCAVAEVGWTSARDYKGFIKRLDRFLPLIDGLGIKYADKHDWNPGARRRKADDKTMKRRNAAAFRGE